MSYTTEAKARKAAEKTLERMKTTGWEITVWENLGWHYELFCGGLSLHGDSVDGTYHCLLADTEKRPSGGLGLWTEHKSYKDPNRAVANQLKIARKFVTGIDRHLTRVEIKLGL